MFLPITSPSCKRIRSASKAREWADFIQPVIHIPGHFFRLGIAALVLLACFAGRAQTVTLANPSFEALVNLKGGWSYLANDGVAGGWQWTATQTNNAGIISGGGISGLWTKWVNVAPHGYQAAFLQNNATLSQTFSVSVATNYLINFNASHRRFGWPTDNLALQVDGVTLNSWPSTTFPDDNFVNCSVMANLSVGTHTLSFVGTPSIGDSAIAIDAVTIGAYVVVGPTALQSDGSLLGTQAAVNNAQNGWTVFIPAGSNVWTGTLTITKDIQLIGAGVGQTIIMDGSSNAVQLINWTTASNHFDRLSGFTFLGSTNTAAGTDASIIIGGTCHAFRLDNCKFDTLQTPYNLTFCGWVYGVVDHCYWNIVGHGGGTQIGHNTYGGYACGDGSWADADNWGTTNALYLEDCTFVNLDDPAPGAHGTMDCENGARVVFRNNLQTNCTVGSHGSESGGRLRSVRTMEVYNNSFYWATNNVIGLVPWGIYVRGGTATVFSNTFVGGFQRAVTLACYRETPHNFNTWSNITGVCLWDSNNPTLFASGNATAVNNVWPLASMQDTSQSWTPNQFNGYYAWNLRLNEGFAIISNGVNQLYFNESSPYSINAGKLERWQIGDDYQIHQVYAAIDQPGFGQGDLITGATPTAAWPNEVIDPVYVWGNSLTMQIPNNFSTPFATTESYILQTNNYVNGVARPNYIPLVYPHPLASGTNVPPVNSPLTNSLSLEPPTINLQPVDQIVPIGHNVSLAVAATGVDLTYSWLYNGTPIMDATNSTFAINAAQLSDAGNYSVVVSNPRGSVTSSTAVLTVSLPSTTVTPPTGLSVIPQ